jgi:hypothetical protein
LDINELIEDIEKYKGGLHAKKNKNNNWCSPKRRVY